MEGVGSTVWSLVFGVYDLVRWLAIQTKPNIYIYFIHIYIYIHTYIHALYICVYTLDIYFLCIYIGPIGVVGNPDKALRPDNCVQSLELVILAYIHILYTYVIHVFI